MAEMGNKNVNRAPKQAAARNNRLTKSRTVACLKISHIPRHFQEEQIRTYFSQFGTVLGVYVPRSKKTLRAKDRAFILVKKEIAEIIASTVHNVLNFNKIMQCKVLDRYYPSWFRRTPQTVSNVKKDKRRLARSAVKSSKNAPKRRMKDLKSRLNAIKKAVPGFEFAMAPENQSAGSNKSP
ncbi:hypothetical protein Aperf_G00000130474 [Anoplocephala perfoliata]